MSRPAWSTARRLPPEATFHLRVNGREEEVTCRGDAPLLHLLRNDLGLRGSRFGCGLAQCGACMVLLDGHPTPSCDVPVEAAEGHDVVTVEGLAGDRVMEALRRSFLDLQAAQCGYCSSGILVSACALLRAEAAPPRPAVAQALERNLCRCGSHERVLRAVAQAAAALAADRPAAGPGSSTTDDGRGDR
ncbi:(2Fe-2S)-binding protein [Geodermatophilus sp. SYSU D00708]